MVSISSPIAGANSVVPSIPASSNVSESIQAQARLDEEIAALTLALSNLRTQRNSFSSISRLPPEILASIFIHCARIHQQSRYPGYRVPDWVNISYVCRHWRDVALNCSTLWSFLFVSSQRWTDELLARSMSAPLNVSVDSEYPKQWRDTDLLRKVAFRADRVQYLSIRLTRQEAEQILPFFASPAPLLRSLQISVERSNHFNEPALIPTVLFDRDTPTLRKLELINYAIPLTSPTLRGLTSLRLRDICTSSQPTLAELEVILSRMQDLAHLHLENALPSVRGNPAGQFFEASKKLSFPQLSRLSIIAPLSTVVLLLSFFDTPVKTEIRLRCCLEADAEDYTPLYPLLAKRFIASNHQGPTIVPVIRTSFIEASSATVGFIFSTVERDSGRRAFSAFTTSYDLGQLCEDWDCNIPLKVDIVLRTSLSRDREDLVGSVYGSMSLTNLQSAHFGFDMGTILSSVFWQKALGHLQELRHISLSELNLQGLVRVLSLAPHHHPKNKGGSQSGLGHAFAPALEELELHNVNFSKRCYGRSQGNPSDCSCSVPCLYDALSNRQAEGYGLLRVVFKECTYVSDYDVKGLRESVTDVHWDGVTRTIPGSESDGKEAEDEDEDDDRPRGRLGMLRFHTFRHDRW